MRHSFALALIVLALGAPARPARAAALDTVAVVTRARAFQQHLRVPSAAPLWKQLGPRMRAAMKDSLRFETQFNSILAQTGPLDSLLSEKFSSRDSLLVYRARCKFRLQANPLALTLAFDAAWRVETFMIRPEPIPYPSAYLDYRMKTPLRLPFRGEWTVFGGGRTVEQNHHAPFRDQRFACDLAMLKDGATHRGDGSRNDDYYCFGQPVLAPAAGTVVWALDSLPDHAPSETERASPIGNGYVIDHGNGEYSVIAHLQRGSLRFKTGDRVADGAEIGRAGNSGNTTEPHLHYHVQNAAKLFEADGLPIRFVDLMVDDHPVDGVEPVQGQRLRRK